MAGGRRRRRGRGEPARCRVTTQRVAFIRRLEGRLLFARRLEGRLGGEAVAPEAGPDPRPDRIVVLAGHRMDPEDIWPFEGRLDLRRGEGVAVLHEVVAGPVLDNLMTGQGHEGGQEYLLGCPQR